MPFTQDDRSIAIATPLGKDKLLLKSCAITEQLGRPFVIRADLLSEAKRRIAAEPDRYVAKVYGETDGGGTQVLYLSHVPFEKLGLPDIGDRPAPEQARAIQHGVYRGFVAPIALYGALAFVMMRNRKAEGDDERTR